MHHRVLSLIFFLVSYSSFSQSPTVEALYYDAKGSLYKIERKYSDSKTQTTGYIVHDNQKSSCVKRQVSLSRDTTIIKESYYRIVEPINSIEKFSDCDSWVISANNSNDTVLLKGYNHEKFIGDTILTGQATEHTWDFGEQIKKARAALILNEKMIVKMDSMVLYETVYSYYLHHIPIKVEIFDANNQKYSEISSKHFPNKIIYERRFITGDLITYQIDTVTWNKTKTTFLWQSKNLILNRNTTTKYHIVGKVLKTIENDSLKKEIEYHNKKTIFYNILINNIAYNDAATYMELRHFEREKIRLIKSKEQVILNKFTYNHQKQITQQVTLLNNLLAKRVSYRYSK